MTPKQPPKSTFSGEDALIAELNLITRFVVVVFVVAAAAVFINLYSNLSLDIERLFLTYFPLWYFIISSISAAHSSASLPLRLDEGRKVETTE